MAVAGKPPILTRVECEVMKVVWRREGGATANDVLREFERPIAYTTALSMLRTLEQKGYVAHGAHPDGGRTHLFRAAIPSEWRGKTTFASSSAVFFTARRTPS
jgi:BlaI family transcriptional regulator, penicillinase repressor